MSWRLQLDGGLAADFDSNLSGLGTELGTAAYNMSEVLALPIFKQENVEDAFQYILNAATSPATKVNEETLTYLNQGKSYEMRLKKLGDVSQFEGKLLKSVVRVLFNDKRLQYAESEQLASWRTNRPGERLIKLDVPLSHNLIEFNASSSALNAVEFLWDPTQIASCFVQVNCISTEFTPKKHGGEKGVVFRLHVDTHIHGKEQEKPFHSASCQVKVFKPKGADRKHKTDRDKMDKISDSEKEKYHPSYECTVLTEQEIHLSGSESNGKVPPSPSELDWSLGQSPLMHKHVSPFRLPTENIPVPLQLREQSPIFHPDDSFGSFEDSANNQSSSSETVEHLGAGNFVGTPSVGTSIQDTQDWLKQNRFGTYTKLFQNFAGADLLRLGKQDLIQIMGPADGIRLNNALQKRHVRPRLTLYVCQEQEQVYHAVYLELQTLQELRAKLATLYHIPSEHISTILRQGPTGIRVLVSDEMVQNFQEECLFSLQTIKDEPSSGLDKHVQGETYTIIMA
ncbi:upstream-binding protein 1-like isoform X1 [Patiria miniata]|uniref:Grh/CP2 DB domain-containing protein n=1 Tax=Patiria miniata TaxID=46514 RepID=A0A914A3G8_PATMI|nr:upstream-binding protein 1-like isoform X1 [Patiria miniata]XP_038058377.1 upstream-binding protein 1-like isoform X2 [Patiria miniata]XP_038058378.1 upstream-binding protein 1-like isoform X1 [Patiria miniata]